MKHYIEPLIYLVLAALMTGFVAWVHIAWYWKALFAAPIGVLLLLGILCLDPDVRDHA